MKVFAKRLFCMIFALILIGHISPAIQTKAAIGKAVIDETIEYKTKEYGGNLLDGKFCELAGNSHTDWLAFAVGISEGISPNCKYLEQLEIKLPDKNTNKPTDLHRIALTVTALGGNPRDFAGRDLISESIFYCENLGLQGVNGYIWALILLDSNKYNIPNDAENNREKIIDLILKSRLESGCYSLNGKQPDTDVTAMAITALSPYYNSDSEVKESIDISLEWLSRAQKDNGSFASWGTENCETIAQVIIALSSLGINPYTDERFIKNGVNTVDALSRYYIDGGGFAHTEGGNENEFATAQAIIALNAIEKSKDTPFSVYNLEEQDNIADDANLSNEASQESESAQEEGGFKLNRDFIIIAIIVAIIILVLFTVARKVSKTKDLIIIVLAVIIIGVLIINSDFKSVEDFYQNASSESAAITGSIKLSIRCDDAFKSDLFDKTLIDEGYIPNDGIILAEIECPFSEGESVFDILERTLRAEKIQMEYEGGKDSAYIEGISFLYEFDCGNTSGWVYKVNGKSPDNGISKYIPADGDKIEIYYVIDYSF